MITRVVTTEKETMKVDTAKIARIVPVGNGDFNVIIKHGGRKSAKKSFTVRAGEAMKLAFGCKIEQEQHGADGISLTPCLAVENKR
jgi:hypothetical protein